MSDTNMTAGLLNTSFQGKPIPTAHDRTFIPYPMGLDPNFEKLLPDTELQEGVPWASGPMPTRAYSNDANDPGGKTGEGIIQKEYDPKRRQWGLPTQDIRRMSKDEERTIYYTDYYLAGHCNELPIGVALETFDDVVNEGTHRGIELLQMGLGFKGKDVDGQFGDQTRNAIKAQTTTDATTDILIDKYKIAREAFYRGLGTFRFFGGDWIRRSETIANQSKALQDKA
jgi:lysozyme family protein